MVRALTVKLTEAQEEAWDKLRAAVGGGGLVLPRDSDVLRFVIAEACKRFGVGWPGEEGSASTSAPPARPAKPGAKPVAKSAKRRP